MKTLTDNQKQTLDKIDLYQDKVNTLNIKITNLVNIIQSDIKKGSIDHIDGWVTTLNKTLKSKKASNERIKKLKKNYS